MLRAFLFPGAVSLLKFCNKSAICYHTLSENSARIMDLSAGIFFLISASWQAPQPTTNQVTRSCWTDYSATATPQ